MAAFSGIPDTFWLCLGPMFGTYARSGKIARFYVNIQTDAGGNIQTAEFSKPTLVKVLEVKDFEKGEPAHVAVASLRQEDSRLLGLY
jgi:hypothetical protein